MSKCIQQKLIIHVLLWYKVSDEEWALYYKREKSLFPKEYSKDDIEKFSNSKDDI